MSEPVVLGIESTCDETAAAIGTLKHERITVRVREIQQQ